MSARSWYMRLLAPPTRAVGKRALPRDALAHYPVLRDESDHPTRWAFPEELDRNVPWVRELAELYSRPESFPASLSPDAGLLLRSLVRNANPHVAVEIGCFLGASTHWIAGALSGRLWSFDDFAPMPAGPWRPVAIEENREPLVRERLGRAGLSERVTLITGDSAEQIGKRQDELRAAGGVDLAFIDGDHTERGVTRDFLAVEPVLNTGGLIVLHDTFPDQCAHEGPRALIDNLRLWTAGVKHRLGVDLPAQHVFEGASVIGEGLYERLELYLGPLNYGLAVLRRIG